MRLKLITKYFLAAHMEATSDYPDDGHHYHASTETTNVPPSIAGKQSVSPFDKPS